MQFFDDIIVLSDIAKALEEQLNGMDIVLKGAYKINFSKSKTRVAGCGQIKSVEGISYGNETIMVADEFCFLVSKLTYDGCNTDDIKSGIPIGRKAFLEKKKLSGSNINDLLGSLFWRRLCGVLPYTEAKDGLNLVMELGRRRI